MPIRAPQRPAARGHRRASPSRPWRAAGLILWASLASLAGCATAINYADPDGPVRVGTTVRPSVATDRLKVVTFNIRFGEQAERAARLFTDEPSLRDPDVLLLQEMDEPGTRAIASRLSLNYVYVPSAVHPHSHRDIGVALLSPWPITDVRKLLLPGQHVLLHLRRAAAVGTVHAPFGAVRVYAVHLETPFGAADATRRRQARAVLADATGGSGPVIVGGDFNGTDGADELARHGFVWLTRRLHDTAGWFDFDHIVASGLCAAEGPHAVRGAAVRGISDHVPVWTVLRHCPTG